MLIQDQDLRIPLACRGHGQLLETDTGPNFEPTVAVVGVGYVGLELVEAFEKKFNVIAFDVSEERILELRQTRRLKRVTWTTDPIFLQAATHCLISVPTLVRPDGTIDVRHIQSALETVTQNCAPETTVVLESSVAVGMTRRYLGPIMEQMGLFGGMSPERVDPGRSDPPFITIPKVISGLDDIRPGSLSRIRDLYGQVFHRLVEVSQPEVAEMTKLYENCQRMVCISFANEMADAARATGIDPSEVAHAAATKPYGYLPVMPGLGVGGHCIPVNPFYLFSTYSDKSFPLLAAATAAAAGRPANMADQLMLRLLERQAEEEEYKHELPTTLSTVDSNNNLDDGNSVNANDIGRRRVKVLVVGLAFKPGQSLTVNSPGMSILNHFTRFWQTDSYWFDPLVKPQSVSQKAGRRLDATQWTEEELETFDIVVVANKQQGVKFETLMRLRKPLVESFCRL